PYCYQLIHGEEVEVRVNYNILDVKKNRFGFSIGEYNPEYSLIIDPELVYSTLIGGSGTKKTRGVTVDSSGNAYIIGYTGSSNYPVTAGTLDESFNGGTYDAFISKINSTGTNLVYSTYIGGTGSDSALDFKIDNSGNAYLTGSTGSSEFPVTSGVFDETFNGGYDTYILKLNSLGNGIIFSTFIGGSGDEGSEGLFVDTFGNVYITGDTNSTDFPTTPGAFDESQNGDSDCFVLKLNSTGNTVLYSTFLGGSSLDTGASIDVDIDGNAYIAGTTASSDYPVTLDAYDETFNGDNEVFATKINQIGSALIYSSYVGGSGQDNGRKILLDSSGNAYIAGNTKSSNFPTTLGAYDETFNGPVHDGFVYKLNSSGSELIFSTYLGGSVISGHQEEVAWGLALDSDGGLYVSGYTGQSDFPTTPNAYDNAIGGGMDAFLSKLNSAGTQLEYSSYFGGDNYWDNSSYNGVALDAAGNVYLSGNANSSDFPTTPGAFDETQNGYTDAYVAKFIIIPPFVTINSPNGGESWEASTVQNITWESSGVLNVKLEYTTNNGLDWTEIVASTSASAKSYVWTVPNVQSSQCLVRITDSSDGLVVDQSDEMFAIYQTMPAMVTIPAVTTPYEMAAGYTVTLSEYEISMTEVTNSQYAEYLNSAKASGDIEVTGGYVYGTTGDWSGQQYLYLDAPSGSWAQNECMIKYNSDSFSVAEGHENWPANWVTWYGAKSYAAYYDFDLPTEAEWQYAASGGMDYNYGTNDGTISNSNANHSNVITHCVNVGSYLANPFGLYDMSGNVMEWCNDWYGSYPNGNFHNPGGPLTGDEVVLRGGNWFHESTYCMVSTQWPSTPLARDRTEGFRVVHRSFSMSLISPDGGESWEATSTQNITWDSQGVTDVKLEYTTNNGTDWTEIVASTAASEGSFVWTVPIRPSGNCKVRISNASDEGLNVESDGLFTILRGAEDHIVYNSDRDGNSEIYVINPDGSNQTRLTNNSVSDSQPSWSPDGTKIVFNSSRDGNDEIYIMDADGSNQINLTNNTANEFDPTWSPDGTKIAYSTEPVGDFMNYEIYVMNTDGSNQIRLTNNSLFDYSPSWSPDGTKLAFVRGVGGGSEEIYVMNADGSDETNLTYNSVVDDSPSWSPDGSRIAYYSDPDGDFKNFEIYVMNADGSNQTRLTNNSADDRFPSWSNGGLKIAYKSDRDGNDEIYIMKSDGSNQNRITYNFTEDSYPSWF
ncbi:SBBP repeat-containing protein, partial [Candidatus Latescibacterota bacterium]